MKNNKIISGLLISTFIVAVIPTISSADNRGAMMQGPRRDDDYRNGTSTRMMQPRNHSTSTRPMMQNMMGIGGVVSSISSSTFTIDNIGRNNATTTYTVNTDASTTYRNGTSTVPFSSLTTGQHVMVAGELSTTTKSISAKSVTIIDPNLRNRDVDRRMMNASSTNPNANGMFHKMLNWFRHTFR